MPTWLVGTSGFSYDDWRGVFYPPELPRTRWLEFYQREFPVVELNVTFYRTPRESTYLGWAAATASEFRFVLKAPRLVSHVKRLAGCRKELERFWSPARLLGDKLAGVLLQTPPSLRFDADLLDGFLASLPKGFPSVAWEVRHASFRSDEALAWFAGNRQPLVVADSVARRLPGVLGDERSGESDSFTAERESCLDAAYYTRPPEFRGLAVPEVLLSGNHARIDQWRADSARERSRRFRPDLMFRAGKQGTN